MYEKGLQVLDFHYDFREKLIHVFLLFFYKLFDVKKKTIATLMI